MENLKLDKNLEPCCNFEISARDQDRFVKMLKALGNPIRFEIMKYLVTHPGCITGDIVNVLPIAQATVSQHLEVLKEAGWIEGTVEGKRVSYCLNAEDIAWFREKAKQVF